MSLIARYTNVVDGTVIRSGSSIGTCPAYSFTYKPELPQNLGATVDLPSNTVYESPKPPRDGDKWSQVKKSGIIKFTNYARNRSSTRYSAAYLMRRSFAIGWVNCPPVWGDQTRAISSWTVAYTSADIPLLQNVTNRENDGDAPDIESELNSLRSRVVSSNLMTFDLLTQLAESHETAKLIIGLIQAAKNPLKAFADEAKTLRGLFVERAHSERYKGKSDGLKAQERLQKRWMEVRYGIMPIVYSIQDAIKLLKEQNDQYKTDRATRTFSYTIGGPPPSPKGIGYYTRDVVDVRLTVIGRARYSSDELGLRLLDQIGFNPFVTAWELIPLSFVVDWFANVGDWVLAQTASLGPGTQQRAFCQVVKETRRREVVFLCRDEQSAEKVYSEGTIKIGPFYSFVESPLEITESETYARTTFTPQDVELQLDVFLNWKRMIDAWCLSQRHLLKAFKKLT